MEAKEKNDNQRIAQLRELMQDALLGTRAHLSPEQMLEGLDHKAAGQQIPNSPHTIWQLIKHLNYWQDRFIARLEGLTTLPAKTSDDGWQFGAAPSDEMAWQQEVEKFLGSITYVKNVCLREAKCLDPKMGDYRSGFSIVQSMASHISYHMAEVVLLRRMLGAWPPPSGGYTW
ncbi:MAG: DinB family protein [Cyclobacteriaceae bacterium]